MYFTDMNNIHKYLLGKPVKEGILKYFPNYCVEFIKSNDKNKCLRIYQTEGWGFWLKKKLIGSIDLELKTEIKTVNIPFWYCNDKNTIYKLKLKCNEPPTDDITANNTKKILFDYAEHFAKINNCNYLQRDVHNNLKEYKDDINKLGFILNGKKADDHFAWLQTFKKIS
jgi:hypothetical protein